MTFGAKLSDLKVAGGPFGAATDVLLNGNPVPGLKSLAIYIDNHCVTEAVLTIGVSDLDIDVETMIALQAYLDAREKSNGN
jgi:hypothetical protein